jgi:hypothetical protein
LASLYQITFAFGSGHANRLICWFNDLKVGHFIGLYRIFAPEKQDIEKMPCHRKSYNGLFAPKNIHISPIQGDILNLYDIFQLSSLV